MGIGTLDSFYTFFFKGDNFCDLLFALSACQASSEKGLFSEEILFLKSRPIFRK